MLLFNFVFLEWLLWEKRPVSISSLCFSSLFSIFLRHMQCSKRFLFAFLSAGRILPKGNIIRLASISGFWRDWIFWRSSKGMHCSTSRLEICSYICFWHVDKKNLLVLLFFWIVHSKKESVLCHLTKKCQTWQVRLMWNLTKNPVCRRPWWQ